MENLKGEKSLLRMLNVVWILSLILSAIMFTIGLINTVIESIVLSGVTGVLSLIGVIYTGGLLIKIKNRMKY